MGLDLFPKRTTPHDTKDDTHGGRTHGPDDACPFADDGFPIGLFGTCCSLRGKVAAENLAALGERETYEPMHDDMDAGCALEFAAMLRATADRLERTYEGREVKPHGGSEGGSIEVTTGEFTPWPEPSFEEAVASIRQAADWYEKVARLGFGVHAWY